MKSSIFLFFQFIYFIGLKSQNNLPYVPLNFINYVPDWYHTIVDSSSITETSNGYENISSTLLLDPIIQENVMYVTFKNANGGGSGGFMILKMDLSNGQLIWRNNYVYNRDLQRQELPRLMYINKKGKLVLLSQRIQHDTTNFGILNGREMKFCQREFDPESGTLLNYVFADDNDSLSMTTMFNFIVPGKNSSFIHKVDDNIYRYIHADRKLIPNHIVSYLLNERGHLLEAPDTILFDLTMNSFFITYLNNDSLLLLQKPLDKNVLHFNYYDHHFNLLSSVVTENVSQPLNIFFVDKKFNDYFLIQNTLDPFTASHILFDKNGKEISTHINDDTCQLVPDVEYLNNSSFSFFDNCYHENDNFVLRLRLADKDFNFNFTNEIYSNTKLKIPALIKHFTLPDGRILLYLQEKQGINDNYLPHESSTALSFIMLDKNFTKPVSSKDQILTLEKEITIFPNPSNGVLTINNPAAKVLSIYNSSGLLIKTFNTLANTIDLTEQPNGLYFVVLKLDDKILFKKIIKH